TTGGLGESEKSGAVMNFVRATGGNSTTGMAFAGESGGGMQGGNTTQALRDAGVVAPSHLLKSWALSGSMGGPVRKGKGGSFGAIRDQPAERSITNIYYNLNAGNPSAWTYAPDFSPQGFFDRTWDNGSLRLTWQAAPRLKITGYWDEQ